ncbi:MAG: VCBS repeat-containing protein, partial [Rubripirellula sp.]|nr:VCBS repeat-containing protein [Rubripirellula sp.]
EQATAIQADGKPINLGNHSTTRLTDWDQDGDLDLVVGSGDGRLWLFRNRGTVQKPNFEKQQSILAGTRDRWGESYTGIVFTNLIGNQLPDLVVCHSDNQITIHENTGSAEHPNFAESDLAVEVQANCQGRFDVADWDADGLPDLITGSFGGQLTWHRNEGRQALPKFGRSTPFSDIRLAYNSHPRLLDFNQDGQNDLLLGVNWGTVSLFLNDGTPKNSLEKSRLLQWSDGTTLNLRENNGDDTTPDLADLDGDGVLDLISGGKNGRLFFMKGVGYASRVKTFETLLTQHASQLGKILREDATVRQQFFGVLSALQADLAGGLVSHAAREQLFQKLAPLAKQYPDILGRSKFNLDSSPHLPLLAGQYWVVLLESLPDSESNRKRVADALNFRAGYRKLLVDFGILFIDNDTATPEHLQAMHRLIATIPRDVWEVETITVADWLGTAVKTQKIRSRSGINIFALPLGRPENSFASDAPRPGFTDVYLICLAHELAHNMLDTVGKKSRPELFERKFECLAQAAGPQVVYRSPKSRGIDFTATKEKFRNTGAWNGDDTTWNEAWKRYFEGKLQFDRAYTRGNVQFFLNAPQEAFATLANQYFADSQLMLDFCKVRWDAGHKSNINQFLLIADYLSEETTRVRFYAMRPGGDLRVTPVQLKRDSQGRIVELESTESIAKFDYQNGKLVTGFQLESK